MSTKYRGAIGFSAWNHRYSSRVVRWFTGEKFSHTFIVHYGQSILEAGYREVNFGLLDKYRRGDAKFEIWVPKASGEVVERALAHTIRIFHKKKFSYLRLVSIGICLLARKYLNRIISSPIRIGTICSEVVWYYLSQLYPEEFNKLNRYDVKPSDLRRVIIESGKFELVETKDYCK